MDLRISRSADIPVASPAKIRREIPQSRALFPGPEEIAAGIRPYI